MIRLRKMCCLFESLILEMLLNFLTDLHRNACKKVASKKRLYTKKSIFYEILVMKNVFKRIYKFTSLGLTCLYHVVGVLTHYFKNVGAKLLIFFYLIFYEIQ